MSVDPFTNATPEQLTDFIDAVQGRALTVMFSRAMERRIRAHLISVNEDLIRLGDNDLMNPREDADLVIGLLACADRGLDCSERERGVWATPGGREHPLPRYPRVKAWRRARFAVRDALTTWRAL